MALIPLSHGTKSWKSYRCDRALTLSSRLIYEQPDFIDFFHEVTPIDEISQLQISSRPARRGGGKKKGLDGLRAIPWVFSWTQTRFLLPAWYGVGTALQSFLDEEPNGTFEAASVFLFEVAFLPHGDF